MAHEKGFDTHNRGWYANLTALQTAIPAGSAGDFAIVANAGNDKLYLWDVGAAAWVDSGSGGAVVSVETPVGGVEVGAVQLTLAKLGADTAADKVAFADTVIFC